MTYAESFDNCRRPIGSQSTVIKGPSSPRSPLGPRNSLDYWQKAEDRQGVAYYWNTTNPYYGMENIYAQQKNVVARRPAPFPLSIPPPTPAQIIPRSPVVSPLSSIPVYHNVPQVPRVKLNQMKLENQKLCVGTSNNNSTTVASRQETVIYNAKPRSEPMIWSVSTDPLRNGNSDRYINVGNGMPNGGTARGETTRSSRQKPRWGRFMQSFCCCVTPQGELDKPSPRSNAALLITQVHKNGSGPQTGPSISEVIKQNDYIPTPTISPALTSIKASTEKFLLPPLWPSDVNKKSLIIDLDETLVHSSFKPVKNPDFVIPVEIDGVVHQVYVLKRPYVDEFLARIGEKYECVLFTASLAKYADPVADLLDKRGVFRSRLFREACVYHKGNYVKDLARLGRDLSRVLIIDNSPASYAFHPDNAIPVQTWFDDPSDVELLDVLPLLERLEKVDSIYDVLKQHEDSPSDALLDRSQ